jgi:hypothetical protein
MVSSPRPSSFAHYQQKNQIKNMLHNFVSFDDLLTPTIVNGGISRLNSFLTSNDIFPSEDVNFYLSCIQSNADEYDLSVKNDLIEKSQSIIDDVGTFLPSDFIDLNELETSGSP